MELPVEGVLPRPAATPAIPIRAGVEVTAGEEVFGAAADAGAPVAAAAPDMGAELELELPGPVKDDAGVIEGGGRLVPGGLIKARGALGGLKADDDPEGEGGMRAPPTRVGPRDGDRAGVETKGATGVLAEPHVMALGVVAKVALLVCCGFANPSDVAESPPGVPGC